MRKYYSECTENRLRWYGHVERMDGINRINRCKEIIFDGCCGRSRSQKTCDEVVRSDLVTKDIHPIFKIVYTSILV